MEKDEKTTGGADPETAALAGRLFAEIAAMGLSELLETIERMERMDGHRCPGDYPRLSLLLWNRLRQFELALRAFPNGRPTAPWQKKK